jgi:hypothetical protein
MKFSNRIDGVIVSLLALNAVNHEFEPRSGHTNDYENGMCFFSSKHMPLRRKSKDWLAQNHQ